MFSNFYKIKSRNMVKSEVSPITSQYGAYALQAGSARLYASTGMHKPTHPRAQTHTLTYSHTNM